MARSKDRNQKTSGHSSKIPRSSEKKAGAGKHNWGRPGSELNQKEAAALSKSLANKKALID
jgi:hypothetical protein